MGNKSNVFFLDINKKANRHLMDSLEKALDGTKLLKKISNSDKTAIKIHFGERGNSSYIRPVFVRKIVEKIKEYGGVPFLTDSNTLYHRKRHNAIDHMITAATNGFTFESTGAPIIIADGLTGKDYEIIKIGGKHLKELYIASSIYNSDFIVAVSHFTAHPLGGFGGAIKNIAMGGSAVRGKFQQHSEFVPGLKKELCKLCGSCIEACNYNAIRKGKDSIYFISENCVGCGECITECNYGAIHPKFKKEVKKLQEKMIEYLMGIKKQKNNKMIYINFLMNITPHCDCTSFSETAFVPDIGILFSNDPIAIDKASVDLVNSSPFNPQSTFYQEGNSIDKFRAINKETDWNYQIDYGVKLGLGNKSYKLSRI